MSATESSKNAVADSTVEARKKPRVCHVVKREDFDGYGFNLHAEKGKPGQYIGKVDENSPAEMAGLRQGDRIIEVNDVNIGTESHKQVVQRIKSNPAEVKLLVVDPEVIEVTKDNQIVTGGGESETNNSALLPKEEEKEEEKRDLKKENDHHHQNQNQTPVTVNTTPAEPTTPKQQHQQQQKPTTPPAINNSSPETKKSTTNGSTPKADTNSVSSAGSTGSRDSGGLNLQMTAAELRAKLAARKKYDPKSESVDIKKKFDIVQKL